jgi:hypothetical protein
MRKGSSGAFGRVCLLAVALACGCGAAPRDAATTVVIMPPPTGGPRIVEPPVLRPGSAEAAAETKARGDAVFVKGDLVFRGASGGLVIGRFEKDRTALLEQGVLYLPDAASDVLAIGDTVYVASGPQGIVVVDVSEPTAPRAITALRTSGAALRFSLEGSTLAVADGAGGVLLVDVSIPAAPRLMTSWTSVDHVRHALVSGEDVYVAEGRAGVSRLRLGAAGLVHAWRHDTRGQARALAVRDGRLYVADGPGGLLILESRPEGPIELGRVPLADMARDVAISGDGSRAFVASGDDGVIVIDIADPAAASVCGEFVPDKPVNRLRREGTTLYVGNDSAGLLVLDIAEPDEPAKVFPAAE